MWLFTTIGFFSIVQKSADGPFERLTIRSRVRADLEALRKNYIPTLGLIEEHSGTDYRYRAMASKHAVAAAMAKIVEDITYSNFKNEVAKNQGKSRSALYGEVWSALYPMQQSAPAKPQPSAFAISNGVKAIAYGGVLIDEQGRILLRSPKGQFDGYVWTFAKGRPDAGETPEQAALREVREETGHEAHITSKLDGCFEGGTTANEYWMMVSNHDHGDFDRAETSMVRWVDLAEAEILISKTTNPTGRKRDLAVLAAVRVLLQKSDK